MEIFVRIGIDKYFKTKIVESCYEAVNMIVNDCLPIISSFDSNK